MNSHGVKTAVLSKSQVMAAAKSRTSRGVFWAYALQAVGLAVSLAMLPFLTRTLGVDSYGTYAWLLNLTGYASEVVAFGVTLWGSREIARRESREERARLFYSLTFARILLSTITCSVWLGIFLLAPNGPTLAAASIPFCLVIASASVSQVWFFIGTQELRTPSLIAVAIRIPFVVTAFICVTGPESLVFFVWLYGGTLLLEGLIQTAMVVRVVGPLPSRPLSDFLVFFRGASPLAASSLMTVLLSGVGLTVLGLFGSVSETGAYSAIFRVPQTILLLFVPLMHALYPVSCRRFNAGYSQGIKFVARLSAIVLPVFGGAMLLLSIFRESLVEVVFGPEYTDYSYLVVVFSIWGLLTIVRNLLGEQILAASGQPVRLTISIVAATLVTVVASLILVRCYGALGAGFAIIIGEVSGLLVLLAYVGAFRRSRKSSDNHLTYSSHERGSDIE